MIDEYKLEFVFRDQSASFARGFVMGQIWEAMKGANAFERTIVAELREDAIAMATHCGWEETITELGDDWFAVSFKRPDAWHTVIHKEGAHD